MHYLQIVNRAKCSSPSSTLSHCHDFDMTDACTNSVVILVPVTDVEIQQIATRTGSHTLLTAAVLHTHSFEQQLLQLAWGICPGSLCMLGQKLQITPRTIPRTEQRRVCSTATHIHPLSLAQHSCNCSRAVPQLHPGRTRNSRHVVRVAQSTVVCGQQQQQQPDSQCLNMRAGLQGQPQPVR